jgi:predicted dehydrogenase
MRFALLGDHPDGLDMARAVAESGRHELAIYSGPGLGADYLRRWKLTPDRVGDLEEVLADPRIDAVIVAGNPGDRPAQLRRALQSERHALCVHPLDEDADIAYEAAMLQADTRRIVFPLLTECLHPAIHRLAEQTRSDNVTAAPGIPNASPSFAQLIELERWTAESVLLEAGKAGYEPGFPGWDVLRSLGGEIKEVTALAATDDLADNQPLLLAGLFESGGLFQMVLLPYQRESRWRIAVTTRHGRSELVFPEGWPGPARLSWPDEAGGQCSESWEVWNPWPRLVETFEAAVAVSTNPLAERIQLPREPTRRREQAHTTATRSAVAGLATPARGALTWQDEIRCLELDAAARRSLRRRRSSTLEYQEATEEAGFKGTMTLVGCSLIWLSLVLLILSVWVPWLAWAIIPVFGLFLALQLLRWVLPASTTAKGKPPAV